MYVKVFFFFSLYKYVKVFVFELTKKFQTIMCLAINKHMIISGWTRMQA